MRRVLVLAAVLEIATGLALLLVPSLVGQLLLGAELTGIAATVARVAGIALIALGIACWPGTPLVGMLTYSAAVTLYLAYVGVAGGSTGLLLWPAVVLHAIPTALLARAWARGKAMQPSALLAGDFGRMCGGEPFAHAGLAFGNVDVLGAGALGGCQLSHRRPGTLEQKRDAREKADGDERRQRCGNGYRER
jgi:hypothetical protein